MVTERALNVIKVGDEEFLLHADEHACMAAEAAE